MGVDRAGPGPPPLRKYERVGQMMIRPLLMRRGTSAYDLARAFYSFYNDLNFEEDFADYCRNGYVAIRPHLFGMVKAIDHEGRRGWFIRLAIGDIAELLTTLPCPLEFLAFCRNNQADKMIIVEYEAFVKKVAQLHGYGNGAK